VGDALCRSWGNAGFGADPSGDTPFLPLTSLDRRHPDAQTSESLKVKPRSWQRKRARQSSSTKSAGYLRCDHGGGVALSLDGSSSAPGAAHRHAGWRGCSRPGRRGAVPRPEPGGVVTGVLPGLGTPRGTRYEHQKAPSGTEDASLEGRVSGRAGGSPVPSRCAWAQMQQCNSQRVAPGDVASAAFFTGVISQIAVGGGVRGRQFGESATSRLGGPRSKSGNAVYLALSETAYRTCRPSAACPKEPDLSPRLAHTVTRCSMKSRTYRCGHRAASGPV
jgi:hypothetical protein